MAARSGSLPEVLGKASPEHRPRMVVFDLDGTLWPFHVDTHVDAPFTKESNGVVFDANGKKVEPFPQVESIIRNLKKEGYIVGVASRTSYIEYANTLLRLFNWDEFIDYKQIYPGSKKAHFQTLSHQSTVQLDKMLFFDDELRNIADVGQLGVTSVLVKEQGMNWASLEEGLQLYLNNKRRTKNDFKPTPNQ